MIGEWYFSTNKQHETTFSKLWNEIFQTPIIPYEYNQRREILKNAFYVLDETIENYLATKNIIEKHISKISAN